MTECVCCTDSDLSAFQLKLETPSISLVV